MPMKYAATMIVYAICLLISGIVTMMVAPPGANAATALIIPAVAAGLMIAAAVLSLMIKKNRKLGMIGIHVGLVLPLVFTAGSLSRLSASMSNTSDFNNQLTDIHTALEQTNGRVTLTLVDDPDSSRSSRKLMEAAWLEGQTPKTISPRAPWRPSGYQAVGMVSIATLSILAFFSLLMHRPSLPEREATDASSSPIEE